MTSNDPNPFRERAHFEASRYGTDPWVFVRELLQNARDAGAHRVWFETAAGDGRESITCRDDGSGMSFEHAQRYLFRLYASSKSGRSRAAGRFGIGFWSVLRFEPDVIVVSSRDHRHPAWRIRMDGRLEWVKRESTTMDRGTEVVLERPLMSQNLHGAVISSILRDAPFLNCRHRVEHPLDIRVDGRHVRAKPDLPPPSLTFRRTGLRGVVGFGPEPRAQIFAHGLRVRDAPTLDELLVERRRRGPIMAGQIEGLAPRVVIDSRDLEVLMARGDAREDRALRRLVSVGHRELGRLVRTELDRHTRLSPVQGLVARVLDSPLVSTVPKAVLAAVVAASLGFGTWKGATWWLAERTPEPAATVKATSTLPTLSLPYEDLWNRYRGPDVDSVGRVSTAVELGYRPPKQELNFAALWVTGVRADGRPDPVPQRVIGLYEGAPCSDDCLEVELGVDAPSGLLRLPVATGHVLDPTSVRLDGLQLPVVVLETGQPAVKLERARAGRLRYRSAPGIVPGRSVAARWPTLPPEVAEFARGLSSLSFSQRASEAAAFIGRRVVYDTSAEVAAKYRSDSNQSMTLFARSLAVGAGDCDVQNSLVAAILARGGVPSRLAVGWLGAGGIALAGLHAWTEYRDSDGVWRSVDASAVGAETRPESGRGPGLAVALAQVRIRLPFLLLAVLALILGLITVTVRLRRGVWRRSVRAGDTDDIVGLLRGAATQPSAFEQIRSLESRRLLRLLSDRSISLRKARGSARRGVLACGSRRSELSRRAARGGGIVLDLDQAEGAAVAGALGAVDLDRWQDVIDGAAPQETTARVGNCLAAAGEPCQLLVGDSGGAELAVLDGTGYGLGRGDRWVVVDEDGRLWRSVCRLREKLPAVAALVLGDAVVGRIGVPSVVRRNCLSVLALDALHEAVAGGL